MPRQTRPLASALLTAAAIVLTWTACSDESPPPEPPCEVQRILAANCTGCHQTPGQFGAPMSLLTLADVQGKAHGKAMTDLIAERIASTTRPMPPPPNPALSEEDKQVLNDWLSAGAPAAKGNEVCSEKPKPRAVYADSSEEPADCENFYEFRAHGEDKDSPWPLPDMLSNDGNRYMCFYFAAPWGDTEKALWLHSLVDNQSALHHWILYGTDSLPSAPGTSNPCSAVQAGSYFIAGWAPGGGDFVLPSNVEMDLPNGPNAGLILEVHYFQDKTISGLTDKSGVRVCTAPQGTREHLAGVSFTGSEGICVPPGGNQAVEGLCDPRDDQGDIHIIGAWPHMHKLGQHMTITVERANGKVEILHDAPFDFASQLYHALGADEWVIHPGDKLRTECSFRNGGETRVPFGERTQDEMCYGFITSWPAGALENDPNNIVQQLGGLTQQERRCMNPVSILQSCNGLADYPTVAR